MARADPEKRTRERRCSSVPVVRYKELLVTGVKGKRRKQALEKQIQFANTLTETKLKSKRFVQAAE